MSGKFFVDTNILVYAEDRSAGTKCLRSQELVQQLWEARQGVTSTQVLQELYLALRRKLRNPISPSEAERIVRDYFEWEVVINNRASLLRAIELETRYRISFWDGLMLQAAERAGAKTVYSEDLSHGQSYAGIRVVNPFSAKLYP
jgi:predicted nucleic acid-binding protein